MTNVYLTPTLAMTWKKRRMLIVTVSEVHRFVIIAYRMVIYSTLFVSIGLITWSQLYIVH